MSTRDSQPIARTIAGRPSPLGRAREIWRYRQLLSNLVRKELKVKYKGSVLGFAWSLANPALYLGVFYVVFELVLKAGIPSFPIFLLSGLLPWNLFTAAMTDSTGSILGNAPLVDKVYFPREILPLAAIGAAVVNFLLQASVLLLALVVTQRTPALAFLPVAFLALVVLVILVAALGIALSAGTVYLRDITHLLELSLLAWFWLTPIVYQHRLMTDRLGSKAWITLLNPMTSIVITFQRAIYNQTGGASPEGRLAEVVESPAILYDESVWWYLRNVVIVGVAATVLLFVGLWIFGRLEDDLAEAI